MGKVAKGYGIFFLIIAILVIFGWATSENCRGGLFIKLSGNECGPDFVGEPFQKSQRDGIYQVSISGIPSFADKGTVETGISKAMMMWENSNPELKFELVEEHGKIHIEFMEFISRDVLGTEAAGYQEGRKLVIELGSYDCRGNWQQYSSNMVADTIAHETGHYLGLEHHPNESHLMYGHDEFLQTEFDDLGYNIPSLNSEYTTWIEWEKLEQQLQRYSSSNNINAYNRIVMEMNCIANL